MPEGKRGKRKKTEKSIIKKYYGEEATFNTQYSRKKSFVGISYKIIKWIYFMGFLFGMM